MKRAVRSPERSIGTCNRRIRRSRSYVLTTLERYSHWMPSMGKHTASAMDEVLEADDVPDAKDGAATK